MPCGTVSRCLLLNGGFVIIIVEIHVKLMFATLSSERKSTQIGL